MSKRAIYAIPLAGLALTSVGCGEGVEPPPPPVEDELVNSFQVDVFNAYETPYLLPDIDVSAAQDGSVICNINFTHTDVTFAADLTGTTTYTTAAVDCVDAAGAPIVDLALIPPDQITNYDIAATVVTLNTVYDITLTDDAGVAVELAGCTLAAGVLDCAGQLVLSQL
jgi:hypothetical protein